jgi:protoheme IX farnesyltransferase
VLWPFALGPYFIGLAGILYFAVAFVLSAAFTGFAIQVWRTEGDRMPKRMFGFSLLYLSLLFALLILDRAPGLLG